jgi:hypothetical protein
MINITQKLSTRLLIFQTRSFTAKAQQGIYYKEEELRSNDMEL